MTEPSPRPKRATKKAAGPRRPRLPKPVQMAVSAARDKKAIDLIVLDLRKSDAFTDFFVIATGANSRQVQAIADGVEQTLKDASIRPSNIEGHKRGEWILVDYFDFVIHVFSPAARNFYGLERLWGTATRIPFDQPAAAAP